MEIIKIKDLSLWEAFLWTARKKQFTGAAKVLGYNTAQVSKRVSTLEELLKTRLFSRTTRNVSLTREGEKLYPQVELLLESAAQIEHKKEISKKITGTLKISSLPSFTSRCLIPNLKPFLKKYPALNIEIDSSDNLINLIENRIDVAIRTQKPTGAQYVFRKLLENKLVLVASSSYLKHTKEKIGSLKDLQKHPLLCLKKLSHQKFKKENLAISKLKCPRPIHCESGSMSTDLCLQGMGIAIRPIWDVRELIKKKKLIQVLPQLELESYGNLYAVTPHRRLIPKRTRAFLDFLEIF